MQAKYTRHVVSSSFRWTSFVDGRCARFCKLNVERFLEEIDLFRIVIFIHIVSEMIEAAVVVAAEEISFLEADHVVDAEISINVIVLIRISIDRMTIIEVVEAIINRKCRVSSIPINNNRDTTIGIITIDMDLLRY